MKVFFILLYLIPFSDLNGVLNLAAEGIVWSWRRIIELSVNMLSLAAEEDWFDMMKGSLSLWLEMEHFGLDTWQTPCW